MGDGVIVLIHLSNELTVFLGGFVFEFHKGNTGGKMLSVRFNDYDPYLGIVIQIEKAIIELPGRKEW